MLVSNIQDVQTAVLLLQSIGVQNLCHDSDPTWEPLLPLCTDLLGNSAANNDSHYLRGSFRRLAEREFHSLEDAEKFYTYNIVAVVLIVCSVAVIAGLFLGLLTLDVLQLRIIERASRDEDEKLYARTVLPIIEERHLLLVTLLLLNTLLYEALPLFLDALVPGWVAILLSTSLIMFFGEILPSGIFTGPHQLYLGYRLAPLTKFFLFVMYPFAKPLAMMLDWLVADEDENGVPGYNRGELSALVRIQFEDTTGKSVPNSNIKLTTNKPKHKHRRQTTWEDTKQEILEKATEMVIDEEDAPEEQLAPPLHPSEVNMIEGALTMKTLVVMDVYTPLTRVYSIADDLVLDKTGFTEIYHMGFSRVPVYRSDAPGADEQTSILGFLMVRSLMLIDWDHCRDVATLPLQRPKCVSPRLNLVDCLRILKSNGYLMVFVCARPDLANKALEAEKPIPEEAGFMGVITLQDIMESLLQDRIYDEVDMRERDRAVSTLQRWAATKLQGFMRKKAKMLRERRQNSFNDLEKIDEATPLLETKKYEYQNGGYS
jgi:metal transporter CNNM